MRCHFLLVLVLCFHAYRAFPSRPDERSPANNERYQLLNDLLVKAILTDDRFVEQKRNQEVMTAFNNLKELKEMLRSG